MNFLSIQSKSFERVDTLQLSENSMHYIEESKIESIASPPVDKNDDIEALGNRLREFMFQKQQIQLCQVQYDHLKQKLIDHRSINDKEMAISISWHI
jgi:hypothetical protein